MRRRPPVSPRAPWRLTATIAATAISVGAIAACGGGDEGDAERFCGEVRANRAQLVDPVIDEPADIEALLTLYRDIAEVAPLDIEAEWQALVDNLATASSVDPDDPDSLDLAYAQAYATERSAQEVRTWLLDHCRVRLPPVATYVAPPTTPPTTVPG